MAYPVTQFGMTFRDYDGETSSLSLWGETLDAANFASNSTKWNTLSSAIQGLSIGRLASHRLLAYNTKDSALKAATKPAQRENKFLVSYHDTGGRIYQAEIPCADTSLLMTNSEYIDLTAGAGQTFKTAFEAAVLSPGDSSAVVVDSVQFVGRRS